MLQCGSIAGSIAGIIEWLLENEQPLLLLNIVVTFEATDYFLSDSVLRRRR